MICKWLARLATIPYSAGAVSFLFRCQPQGRLVVDAVCTYATRARIRARLVQGAEVYSGRPPTTRGGVSARQVPSSISPAFLRCSPSLSFTPSPSHRCLPSPPRGPPTGDREERRLSQPTVRRHNPTQSPTPHLHVATNVATRCPRRHSFHLRLTTSVLGLSGEVAPPQRAH